DYGQKVYSVNGNAHAQYKTKKSLFLLLGGYGFLKGDNQSFVDHSFVHFRYNYKLTNVVRLEAFTQLQQNVITKIQSRFLIGAGPRFKILGRKKIRLYAGSLPMNEIEKEKNNPSRIYDWRLSSYVSFSFIPNRQTELTTTTYYQPVLFDASDSRWLNQTSFKISAGKKLGVVIRYNYSYDASPPPGVPTNTYSFSTGIEVDL
ncbi:MAG TPA: DUF481 domain-containing protein, partial [Ferruginibacter sp.]|nr:DUF481 domain-containing protein [Ferruginibacter sp.]